MLTTNSNTPGRQDDGISKENVNNWAEWTPYPMIMFITDRMPNK
jgi:hypothetical protein